MNNIFKPIREDEIEERRKKWIELQGWRGWYIYVDDFYEGLARVMDKKGLRGFVNEKGEEVIKCKYRNVYSFSEGLAVVMNQKGLYGYINKKGEEVIKCKYGWICKFINGRAKVRLNNEIYYINREGKRISE